jgi:hypothetical protein
MTDTNKPTGRSRRPRPAAPTTPDPVEIAMEAEASGKADERSFVWRAAYYDVVLLAVLLCHGQAAALDMAPVVMMMYGEPFADYREEFPHA